MHLNLVYPGIVFCRFDAVIATVLPHTNSSDNAGSRLDQGFCRREAGIPSTASKARFASIAGLLWRPQDCCQVIRIIVSPSELGTMVSVAHAVLAPDITPLGSQQSMMHSGRSVDSSPSLSFVKLGRLKTTSNLSGGRLENVLGDDKRPVQSVRVG